MKSAWAVYVAEFIATFLLIFVGAGSVVINALTNGGVGLMGIALAHGLAIALGVNAIGHISGGHINPAVTIAMFVTKRVPFARALGYIIAQLAGAAVAAKFLTIVLPMDVGLKAAWGATLLAPGMSFEQGMLIEAVLTFFLLFAVFGAAVDPRGPRSIAGFVIGLTISMDILIGGPLTGAALNPARAFGPALVSGMWAGHTIYWIGPIIGAVAAAVVYDRWLLGKN